MNLAAIAISQVTRLKYVLHNIHCEHYSDRYLSDYRAPRIIYAKYHQIGVAYAGKPCRGTTWGFKDKWFNYQLFGKTQNAAQSTSHGLSRWPVVLSEIIFALICHKFCHNFSLVTT